MNCENSFILHGDIAYCSSENRIRTADSGYLVCVDGVSAGVYATVPEQYRSLPVRDYTGMLILPGMVDLHIHAPQYEFRGTGMDMELLDWLNTYTFPTEARYNDPVYADKAYGIFADAIRKSATTRMVAFATMNRQATEILMEKMEQTGIVSYIGKINMDRESIPALQEKSFLDSAFTTFGWINSIHGKFKNTYPILTPRFIPTCSDELLQELREIILTYHIPLQSHLSENKGEITWVKELCPESRFYGDAYDRQGLFGTLSPTIMAHCIHSGEDEIALMKKNGVFIAHCPASNSNLSSGIAPVKRYLRENMRVGLGSDVAGGENESIFRAIVDAIQVSKLRWRLVDDSYSPLSFPEAFYLATKGGGEFFGKVGSFEPGYEMDAIVIDDGRIPVMSRGDVLTRLERAVYQAADRFALEAKYVRGREINLT